MPNAKIIHRGKMVFEGNSGSGHQVLMDSSPEVGGENKGIRPMEMVLLGLGGCTGIDVVSILNKMRIPFDSFEIEVLGKRAADHPKVYEHVTTRYAFAADAQYADKIIRAVSLSQEKYCSVSAMVAKSAHIDAEVYINGEKATTLSYDVAGDKG